MEPRNTFRIDEGGNWSLKVTDYNKGAFYYLAVATPAGEVFAFATISFEFFV